MSLYPCSLDGKRHPGKLAQVYWAWVKADGERLALRQRLCQGCYMESVYPVAIAAQSALAACPVCHISTVDDMDPVYATVFLPKQPRGDVEMALCPPCAVRIRVMAQTGSEPLEDRGIGVGGPAPLGPDAADSWAAIGIPPVSDPDTYDRL